jgi:hypothetical protein
VHFSLGERIAGNLIPIGAKLQLQNSESFFWLVVEAW